MTIEPSRQFKLSCLTKSNEHSSLQSSYYLELVISCLMTKDVLDKRINSLKTFEETVLALGQWPSGLVRVRVLFEPGGVLVVFEGRNPGRRDSPVQHVVEVHDLVPLVVLDLLAILR